MKLAVFSAHTCPLSPLGGWETGGMNVYVRELSRELGARGVKVDVFTRRQAERAPEVVEFAPGARVIHVDAGPRRPLDKYDVLDYLPDFACGVQRWRALTGSSYDLIHSHYWLSGRLATLFQERWNVPMVTMFHTLAQLKNRVAENDAEREQSVRAEIELRTMSAADRVIAATQVDRGQIVRYYGAQQQIDVIPGGVDLARFHPIRRDRARARIGVPTNSRVLLFVGRIQRLKGLDILLKALKLVRRVPHRQDVRLLIVGGLVEQTGLQRETHEQAEINRVRQLATRLGIASHVTFVGAVQQNRLPLYYSAADLTVMPSSYESFGLVAVESLACGTPVVATRVGGLTTILRDGETGVLVPWRHPQLFAESIGRLLDEPALLGRMRRQARSSVEQFGWDCIAEQHLSLFQQVLVERRTASEQLG